MALKQKLKKILEERFPAPDKVEVIPRNNRIIGVVTSADFRRKHAIKRQDLIDEVLKERLTPKEKQRVLTIVALTPEEEKVQRAIHDWNGVHEKSV
jgi:acid stress-induced BolA-like protein IbaG/YrbA